MNLRSVLAVLAAFVVNFVLVGSAEWGLSQAFPTPHGANMSDPNQLEAFMNGLPIQAFLGVLAAWAVGAVAAAATAYFIAGRKVWASFAGAGTNLLGVLITVATIPHPLWVAAVGMVVPLMAAAAIPRFGGSAAV